MTGEKIDVDKLAGMAFDEALSKTDPQELLDATKDTVSDGAIERLIAQFEDSAYVDDADVEFWYARELQVLFDYATWDKFVNIIEKAKISCETSGYKKTDHFSQVGKMVDIGSGAERAVSDIKLTRYACYLIAQNGDSRKKPVAFAQTYFAIQTRRQEIRDEGEVNYIPMSEDHKRLLLRDEIKEHNKRLASATKGAGVVKPLDFAVFQNFGYKGMYGGLDNVGIKRTKGLKKTDNILDHMGSTELAANLFRATQAEDKLKRDNIKGKANANQAHFEVGQKVRQAIKDIGGVMPEQLPTAENIVKVARKIQKAIKDSTKKDSGDK